MRNASAEARRFDIGRWRAARSGERSMKHPVIDEIESCGLTTLPDGKRVPIHGNVGPESGKVIQRAIEATGPRKGIEVGLAFGMSTLYILDAMQLRGEGQLIGMDPAQHDATWRGGGLYNVQRAGFDHHYIFHEEPSQFVLPRLAAAGTRIQFAFIDGWHTFDHTLVDFFFIDKMLDVGGIIVIDDVGYPSIRRLCHFILSNRDYVFFDCARYSWRSLRNRLKHVTQTILHPLVRDDFTPDATGRAQHRMIEAVQLIALRKEVEDRRSFDHFVAF
jgi:predicted O-methyltransferase YrrM